jgi:Hsp20/alpha crystallin family
VFSFASPVRRQNPAPLEALVDFLRANLKAGGLVWALLGAQAVTVSAELPGLSENDVQVEIANGVLSIRGEKKAERSDESKFVSECYYGSFERQIPLDGVEEDKAQADFRTGHQHP